MGTGCTGDADRHDAGPSAAAPAPLVIAAPTWTAVPGVYIQNVSLHSATIAVAEGRTVTTTHLTGLPPDSEVTYTARAADGRVLLEGRLRTAPPPGKRPVVFGVVGDMGWRDPTEQLKVRNAMAASDPALELVVTTGDNVYPAGEWERIRPAILEPYAVLMNRIPWFFTYGNHDSYTESGAPFDAFWIHPANNVAGSDRYYSFDWGDVHFAVMDNVGTPFTPGTPQYAWLEADLATSRAPWKIALSHYNFYGEANHGDHAASKHHLSPLLKRLGVPLVINGHEHAYERFRPVDGVHYVVTGGGGAQLRSLDLLSPRLAAAAKAHHYLRGRADAASLTIEAVDTAGAVFDTLRLLK